MTNAERQLNRRVGQAGFTLVEVAAALVILSMVISSALVVMNQITSAMIDLKSETIAFSVARQNMEYLLTQTSVSDLSDYGVLETFPDIDWQTTVEPFYEPVTNRMWVRGVCSSGYTSSSGERKMIELTCWLSKLTDQQVKQVETQQKQLQEFMNEFSSSEYGRQLSSRREMTIAYLESKGIDTEPYQKFVEQLERRRLDYIAKNAVDEGYSELEQQLQDEETDYIYRQPGASYEDYMAFYEEYVNNSPADYDEQQDPENSKTKNSRKEASSSSSLEENSSDSSDDALLKALKKLDP